MNEVKNATLLFVDHGLNCSLAEHLAQSFERVLYWIPWESSFPTSNLRRIGLGLENVERIYNLWDNVDEADIACFPDVYHADIQNELIRRGIPVWGSNIGDQIELERWKLKSHLKKLKLPVQPVERVVGLTALRDLLMNEGNRFIKISVTRGDMESWFHHSFDTSEPRLAELEMHFGGGKEIQEFIVEHPIEDAVEVGYDGWGIDGEFPSIAMAGIEVKDVGYVGAVQKYSEMDRNIVMVNEAFAPMLKKNGYRNFMSTELRVAKDGEPYLIDFTARQPIPPGDSYQLLYANLAEIIWAGAQGEVIEPETTAEFAVQAMIYAADADKGWTAIDIDDESRANVKLLNHCRISGVDYVVPTEAQMKCVGSVIGTGETMVEAVKDCQAHAKGIHGTGLTIHVDALTNAVLELESAEEKGIEITDKPLPNVEEIVDK